VGRYQFQSPSSSIVVGRRVADDLAMVGPARYPRGELGRPLLFNRRLGAILERGGVV
jgi:hypothetical protein